MCSDEENGYCGVTPGPAGEHTATLNECEHLADGTEEEESVTYHCECKDPNYIEIKNEDDIALNCTPKWCNDEQQDACKVIDGNQTTGNRCILLDPINSRDHDCTCAKPYFSSTEESLGPICDLLPPREFYLKKPVNQTVYEGNAVILDCVVDRAVNACKWLRGRRRVLPSAGVNATTGNYRYTLLGHECDGICTLRINSASLTFDDVEWTCVPILEGTDIPSVKARVRLIVIPQHPTLVYGGKVVEENETVYISLGTARVAQIQVKCISRFGYPQMYLNMTRDGIPFKPMPEPVETRDPGADTLSAISTASFPLDKKDPAVIRCNVSNIVFNVSKRIFQATEATFVAIDATYEVAVTPPGPHTLNPDTNKKVILTCHNNGFPPTNIQWQEYDEENEMWLDIPYGHRVYIEVKKAGHYRCTAGNEHNVNGRIPSGVVIVEGSLRTDNLQQTDVRSTASCLLSSVYLSGVLSFIFCVINCTWC